MFCCFGYQKNTHQMEINRKRRARTFVPFALATVLTLASREWWPTDKHTSMPPLTPGILISSLLVFFVIFYCPTPAWMWRAVSSSTSTTEPQNAETLPGPTAAWIYLMCMILVPLLVAMNLRSHAPTAGLPLGTTLWVVLGAVRLGVRCRGDAEMMQTSTVRIIMVRLGWSKVRYLRV